MAIVKPFKAIRPTSAKASEVAALPYDVMSTQEAREMVVGKPNSFLHVDKAEIDLPKEIDLYDPLVYQKAKENLDNMRQKGVLIQDERENFYIYRLTMNGRSQTGLVVCTSIDEYLNNTIKKHELTREDKEQDRIRHVESCNANTGPIFLTYRPDEDIDKLISTWMESHQPCYDFVSEDGISHQVFVIDDDLTIMNIQAAFASVPALYIADGHHRNASAVKVGLKRRDQNPNYDENAEFNFYLSVVFPSDQLHIMDYNRLVKNLNGLTDEAFVAKVKESFNMEVWEQKEPCKPQKAHQFGMYWKNKWYLLTVKPQCMNENDLVEKLDVSLLQNLLLKPILGIDDPRTSKNIDFVGGLRGLHELERRVNSGEMTVAFAMFPTSMTELMDIADADKLMPPKSTWFEPKLRSGLFIHELD